MLLTEIDHIAIAVEDLDAAVEFYRTAFGAEVAHREIIESDATEEVLIKVADSYIQLAAPTTEDSPIAKFLEKRGPGLHHVGYRVANCAEALEAMKAAGATPDRRKTPAWLAQHHGGVHPPQGGRRIRRHDRAGRRIGWGGCSGLPPPGLLRGKMPPEPAKIKP